MVVGGTPAAEVARTAAVAEAIRIASRVSNKSGQVKVPDFNSVPVRKSRAGFLRSQGDTANQPLA